MEKSNFNFLKIYKKKSLFLNPFSPVEYERAINAFANEMPTFQSIPEFLRTPPTLQPATIVEPSESIYIFKGNFRINFSEIKMWNGL